MLRAARRAGGSLPSGSVVCEESRIHILYTLSNHHVRLTRIDRDRLAFRRHAQHVAEAEGRWSRSSSCADTERKNGHRSIRKTLRSTDQYTSIDVRTRIL